jgi:hypothetical protein
VPKRRRERLPLETIERLGWLLIGSLEPIAQLLDAIHRFFG